MDTRQEAGSRADTQERYFNLTPPTPNFTTNSPHWLGRTQVNGTAYKAGTTAGTIDELIHKAGNLPQLVQRQTTKLRHSRYHT